jgi:hypothetical protein
MHQKVEIKGYDYWENEIPTPMCQKYGASVVIWLSFTAAPTLATV